MAKIFWDTNLFIYLLEQNPTWLPRVVELRKRMVARQDRLLTSWLTVGEILTKPKETGNARLEKSYLQFFSSSGADLIAFDSAAALKYAEIRSKHRVRPPDAIQLACAAAAGTDLFVTNDSHLSELAISGITFVTTLDRIPL